MAYAITHSNGYRDTRYLRVIDLTAGIHYHLVHLEARGMLFLKAQAAPNEKTPPTLPTDASPSVLNQANRYARENGWA